MQTITYNITITNEDGSSIGAIGTTEFTPDIQLFLTKFILNNVEEETSMLEDAVQVTVEV